MEGYVLVDNGRLTEKEGEGSGSQPLHEKLSYEDTGQSRIHSRKLYRKYDSEISR